MLNHPLSSNVTSTSSILTVGGTAANRSPLTSTPPSPSPSSTGSGSVNVSTSTHGVSTSQTGTATGLASIDSASTSPMAERIKSLASGHIGGPIDGKSNTSGVIGEPRRRKSLSISLSSYKAEQFASASLKQIKQLGKKLQAGHSIDLKDSSKSTSKGKGKKSTSTIEEEESNGKKPKSRKAKSEIIIKENTSGILR